MAVEGARNDGKGSALRDGEKAPVAYERFAEVNTENKALKARVAELEPKAAEADKLAPKLEKLKTEYDGARATWDEERGLFTVGVTDPEGHAVARTLFQSLPVEGKPATLAEWVSGFKEDPTKAPRGLAPYLPQAVKATGATPAATPAAGTVTAPPPAGGGKAPGAPAGITADIIRAARERAAQTGDMTQLQQLLKQVSAG